MERKVFSRAHKRRKGTELTFSRLRCSPAEQSPWSPPTKGCRNSASCSAVGRHDCEIEIIALIPCSSDAFSSLQRTQITRVVSSLHSRDLSVSRTSRRDYSHPGVGRLEITAGFDESHQIERSFALVAESLIALDVKMMVARRVQDRNRITIARSCANKSAKKIRCTCETSVVAADDVTTSRAESVIVTLGINCY